MSDNELGTNYSDSDETIVDIEANTESDKNYKKYKKYIKKIKKQSKSLITIPCDKSIGEYNPDYDYGNEKIVHFNPFNLQIIKGDCGPMGP